MKGTVDTLSYVDSLNQDLYDACKNGDVTRMKQLLLLGANVNHYDQSMMLCSLNKELYDACKRGNVTRMKELTTLVANG